MPGSGPPKSRGSSARSPWYRVVLIDKVAWCARWRTENSCVTHVLQSHSSSCYLVLEQIATHKKVPSKDRLTDKAQLLSSL